MRAVLDVVVSVGAEYGIGGYLAGRWRVVACGVAGRGSGGSRVVLLRWLLGLVDQSTLERTEWKKAIRVEEGGGHHHPQNAASAAAILKTRK